MKVGDFSGIIDQMTRIDDFYALYLYTSDGNAF